MRSKDFHIWTGKIGAGSVLPETELTCLKGESCQMATLMIDRLYKGVGRIQLRSGTKDSAIHERMVAMLNELAGQGRLDVLQRIKDKKWKLIAVFSAFQRGDLKVLATTNDLLDFKTTYFNWLPDHQVADITRASYTVWVNTFLRSVGDMKLNQLAMRLGEYRKTCLKKKTGAAFNRLRAAVLAFVKYNYGAYSDLYRAVANNARLRETEKIERRPLTPLEVESLCHEMPPHFADMARSMAYTGMNFKEYAGKWDVKTDRVAIYGTKKAGRKRVVPLLQFTPVPPDRAYQRFRMALKKTSMRPNTHDFRHSYKLWLSNAGIPPVNINAYMGHKGRGIEDLYGKQNGEKFLTEDRETLKRWIEKELAKKRNLPNDRA